MARKKNRGLLGLVLLGIGAVGAISLGKDGIKNAFASESNENTATTPVSSTEKPSDTKQISSDSIPANKNEPQVILINTTSDVPIPTSIKRDNSKTASVETVNPEQDVFRQFENVIPNDILNNFRSIDSTPQVQKPDFLSSSSKANPKEFNKQKFGIDNLTLANAITKKESQRTIDEKKQIEAEKARQIFDSRGITNF